MKRTAPKFRVGQVVYDRKNDRYWKVKSATYDHYLGQPDKWWYRPAGNSDLPSVSQEHLRPLAAREIGPRPKAKRREK